MNFQNLPEVKEAKSLVGRDELIDLGSEQSPFRHLRIVFLWILKLTIIFLLAPRTPLYWWPFYLIMTVAVIEGFRNWTHESLHQQVFCGNQALNRFLTIVFLTLPIVTPFSTRQTRHFSHHRVLNSVADPEQLPWRHFITDSVGRKLLYCLTGTYFARSALSARARDPRGVSRQRAELLMILAYFTIGICGLWLAGRLLEYGILWVLPQVLISPLVNQARTFAEHGGTEESAISRTTVASVIERVFMYQANFGFHFEHHVWPAIPEAGLPKVHSLLIERGFYSRHAELLQHSGIMFGVSEFLKYTRRRTAPNTE